MTPGARLQTAVELLEKASASRAPADVVLDSFFRGKRFVGAKDRRAISDRVFGCLRRRARLGWWVRRALGEDVAPDKGTAQARASVIADLVLTDAMTADRVSELFSGARHCPEPLGDIERILAETLEGEPLDHGEMPDWVRLEFPAWLEPLLKATWGEALDAEMAALNETAKLDFRVNAYRASREEARAVLGGDGIEAHPTPYSPLGLRVGRRIRLGSAQAYRDGLVEVQDEGSQLVALMCDARPGMEVVDFCAGAGGKTLALAALMGGSGRVWACDVSAKRLGRLSGRSARAQPPTPIETRTLGSENDPWVAEGAGRFDRVLVDAPCSGSGTWRRIPDAKWSLTPAELDRMVERQRRVLAAAGGMVKPGGRLIYATCSVLPVENDDRVASFLRDHPEFAPVPAPQVWAEAVGGPCPVETASLQLTPARHGTDGFFVAVLERRA